MVKVKECCCGCTLRTGTLILAWSMLIIYCILFLTTIWEYLTFHPGSKTYQPNVDPPSLVYFIYMWIEMVIAIVASVIAIWATQKKKAKYLNGLYWYFCYLVIYFIIDGILTIFDPNLEKKIAQEPALKDLGLKSTEFKIWNIIINLFAIALLSYFALVVRSRRDYALRNEAQNDDIETPDPTVIGYINNV